MGKFQPKRDELDELRFLIELRQARNPELMAREVARLGKTVNQRFYRLEQKGIERESFGWLDAVAMTEKEKPRFSTNVKELSKLDISKLYEMALDLKVKAYAKSTTIQGVKDIRKDKLTKSISALEEATGATINKETFEEFLKAGGGDIMNNKFLSSTQIVEDWLEFTQQKDIHMSSKEFIAKYKQFNAMKDPDSVDPKEGVKLYERATKNLKNLMAKKEAQAKNSSSKQAKNTKKKTKSKTKSKTKKKKPKTPRKKK